MIERLDDYWGEPAKAERIEYSIIPNVEPPRTPTGKIRRIELREREPSRKTAVALEGRS